ncbi:MAG: cytochrome c oxidase subunit II [Candidatus Mycalebacterium zealandia]|nr:MAG: cytochrome c oxidase subunit II [Candidatus Mycalebacterium zealandia]
MNSWLPEAASEIAPRVDNVLIAVTVISFIFFIIISVVLVVFAVKYRRKTANDRTPSITGNEPLEIAWTVVPSIILVAIFIHGLVVFNELRTPPNEAVEVTVVSKQWLWQFEYPNGKKTINELNVQQNLPVKMIMRSDDVLHSLFIPAFRVKQDILPGRFTQLWFTPTKVGSFIIFCAEYCGTGHSQMLARVNVMSPEAFARWEGKGGTDTASTGSFSSLPAHQRGEKLYKNRGCNACHSIDGSPGIAPTFKGVFGRIEELKDGSSVRADENYLIESIYEPQAKMVAGYEPVMPSFKGILSESDVSDIIEYVKTLK